MGGYAVRTTSLRGEGKKTVEPRVEVLKLTRSVTAQRNSHALALSVKTSEAHKATQA